MIDEKRVNLDQLFKVVYDQLNGLVFYDNDKHITKILEEMNRLARLRRIYTVALLSNENAALNQKFERLTHMRLQNMKTFQAPQDNAKIKMLLSRATWIPFYSTKGSRTKETAKYIEALTTNQQERPVLAVCSFKKVVNGTCSDARRHLDLNYPKFHSEVDIDARSGDLAKFRSGEERVLVCTRRILYGTYFEFVPVLVLVQVPSTLDELVYILQWYVTP